MFSFLPTIILRHRKENLKKCSLRGLEQRKDMVFYRYPNASLPPLKNYLLLHIDAPVLSIEDKDRGVFLIDATWRYAKTMVGSIKDRDNLVLRSLPKEIQTAYPRRQTLCEDTSRGLASIEALYIAYKILGRDTDGLLDQYYWKDEFTRLNAQSL